MSIYDNSIRAFIQVIESKSNLISHQDWDELHQLSSNFPEDVEEISEIIENWLQFDSRNQILQAYEQKLEVISSSSSIDLDKNLGIANSQSPTKPNQPSLPYKELLDNSIKKNSPLLNPPPPKQQQ
ncbi:hypothetical protein [Rivularia sp. UHCC 0363]|uniref:hypothetical protein n=1 Tax=Rivularia sp. UHCC 0363 TaxID=3110244 RepID=UPI002B2122F9|nr:hypothetical protein [Rivularia sp. UHCC 0363]MEA5594763.1 hypothetical protein [Rivularia sp. UHCC 0363]